MAAQVCTNSQCCGLTVTAVNNGSGEQLQQQCSRQEASTAASESNRTLRACAVQAGGKKSVEVTLEDQQQINMFSKLAARHHELQDILKVKSVRAAALTHASRVLVP